MECDLGQAQGRAKFSSQARPLWRLLPDGAFKRLVLGEIAQKIQIDARELSELWAQAEAQEKRFQRGSASSASHSTAAPAAASASAPDWVSEFAPSGSNAPYYTQRSTYTGRRNGKFQRTEQRPMMTEPRVVPSTGPDQAVRLLLSQMHFMERLDNDDLDTLVNLPAPHGPLFSWIESQFQENGPQPWAMLHDRISATPHGALALQLMSGPHGHPEGEEQEQYQELRNILSPMLAKRIKQLETELLMALATNPSDKSVAERYRSLLERRSRLQATPSMQGN